MNIHERFHSSLVRIDDYDCHGKDSRGEECASAYEIDVVRSGTFVRRDSAGTNVADVNHVLFYHKDRPFQIQHPGGGDRSTVFTVPEALFLRCCARSMHMTSRFCPTWG
jgi:hypothetical protein